MVDAGWMETGNALGNGLVWPDSVSLWCFLGTETDIAIWFRRPNMCLIVAYVHEKTLLLSSTEVCCDMYVAFTVFRSMRQIEKAHSF